MYYEEEDLSEVEEYLPSLVEVCHPYLIVSFRRMPLETGGAYLLVNPLLKFGIVIERTLFS